MNYEELPTDEQVKDADEMWGVTGFQISEPFRNERPHEDDAKATGSAA